MPTKQTSKPKQPALIIMGVSGCGKSTVAQQLSEKLGWGFIEGDVLHSKENVDRMAAGIALEDEHRADWLKLVGESIARESLSRPIICTCSALKKDYRDLLRQHSNELRFVLLHGTKAILEERMAHREHFMPVSLLESQLKTLETPTTEETDVITISIEHSISQQVDIVVSTLIAMGFIQPKYSLHL